MTATTADTNFAPAGRDGYEALCATATCLDQTPLLREMVDAVPNPVLVLNDKRQMVVANRALLALVQTDEATLRGRRPGEIVHCTHSAEGPDGCGTSVFCQTCGAVGAILDCQQSHSRCSRECRLTRETPFGPASLDLQVTVSPLKTDSGDFMLAVMEDIGKQKRLEVLTRTFFHDVLNTAGAIRGFAQLLEEDLPRGTHEREEARQLGSMAGRLVDEIECQRDLTRAENGQRDIDPRPVRTVELLDELRTLYAAHEVAVGRQVVLGSCWDGSLLVDARLLTRVLGNMIKNAVEATPKGGRVVIQCEDLDRQVAFHVNNPTVMPEEVRLQIFQRSFSTKGDVGRGIGTYSLKLFGEIYLGGQVSFTSREPEGTTFSIVLPKVRFGGPAGTE